MIVRASPEHLMTRNPAGAIRRGFSFRFRSFDVCDAAWHSSSMACANVSSDRLPGSPHGDPDLGE
jgi:hypothetical protein